MPPQPRLPTSELQGLRRSVEVGAPLDVNVSFVKSANATGVPVIWVHGTPGQAQDWSDYVLDPVPGTFSLALDRPGFGHSGPPGAVTSLERQVAAVAALLPGAGQPAIVVGHSLGGAVAAQLAAQYPERVLALVLLASSLDPGLEVIHPMQYLGKTWPVANLLPRALRNANDELMVFKSELVALEPMLKRITAPTLILHGTLDDLVPFGNVAYMQSRLLGVACLKIVVLEGQNHFLPWNSEPSVREAIAWAVQQGKQQTGRC
jgi:pimeloyl-ACP methyl ester carboxylesterase